MSIKKLLLALGTVTVMATALLAWPGVGLANLTIMPLRVVFEDRDRSVDMTLANSSNTTQTYRLEWTYNRMNESGVYTKSETPIHPGLDFKTAVVFSPRQVTLAPGARQSIRLSLRRPADLPEGEYRAHLNFVKLAGSDGSITRSPAQGVTMKLGVNLSFSVPVIVRVGAYDAQAAISNIQLLPPAAAGQGNQLTLDLNRTGKNSTAGRILVFWAPPGGKEEQIGILNNINVFTETDKRKIGIGLTNTQPMNAGALRVVYEGMDKDRGQKWAETTLPIQ